MLDGLIISALGVLLGLYSASLHDGGPYSLSPALFPALIALALALAGAALLLESWLRGRQCRPGGPAPALYASGRPLRPLAWLPALVLLAAYLALLPLLHFNLATFLFLTAFFRLAGEKGRIRPLLLAALFTGAAFLIFGEVLEIALP